MRSSVLAFVLAAAACGGGSSSVDAPPLTPPASCNGNGGVGTVTGSVGGESFATVGDVHVQSEDDVGGFAAVLQDTGSLCGGTGPDDYGEQLLVFFCDNPPGSGDYTITNDLTCAQSGQAAATLKSHSGASQTVATAGTATIDMSDDTCVTGTFALVFDGGTLSGTFGGEYCRASGGGGT